MIRSRTGVEGRGNPRVPPEVIIDPSSSTQSPVTGPITVVSPPANTELIVPVDTSDAGWSDGDSITLPGSPNEDVIIVVKDVGGEASIKTIVVDGNGSTIDGAPSQNIGNDYESLRMAWRSGLGWMVI